MFERPLAIVCVVLSLVLSTGCLDDGPSGDRVFLDETGGVLRLDGTPMRVMTLSPALTEIVFLLGCGDRLVGVDSDSNYPPEAAQKEKVSDWQDIDRERIVAIGPDLVLLDRTLDESEKRYAQLNDLGIPVYRIYPTGIEPLLKDIEEIAKVLDVAEEGARVTDGLRARISAVSAQALNDTGTRPSVMQIVYYDGTSDPWVMTSSTFSGNLIEIAGGENTIDDPAGMSVQIDLERVVSEDPDIIVCSQSELWPTPSRERVLSEPVLRDVSAVRNGFVRDMDGDLIDRTGPRLVDGLEALRSIVVEHRSGG